MLFLRTNDDVNIITKDGTMCYNNNKRKGQQVLKFKINREDEDKITFFEDELISRMIPKNAIHIFQDHPIKIVQTSSGNVIAFQDLDCKIHFLTLDPITGEIEKISFDEIDSNDDSILCYDEDSKDWYIDDVESIYVIYLNDEERDDTEFENMELSNYLISSDNGGIIVNQILIA